MPMFYSIYCYLGVNVDYVGRTEQFEAYILRSKSRGLLWDLPSAKCV